MGTSLKLLGGISSEVVLQLGIAVFKQQKYCSTDFQAAKRQCMIVSL